MALQEDGKLVGLISLAPTDQGFVLPVFSRAPASNSYFVQILGGSRRIQGFKALSGDERIIPVTREEHVRANEESIWALQITPKLFVVERASRFRSELHRQLSTHHVQLGSYVNWEVERLFGSLSDRQLAVRTLYYALHSWNPSWADYWLSELFVLPTLRQEVLNALRNMGRADLIVALPTVSIQSDRKGVTIRANHALLTWLSANEASLKDTMRVVAREWDGTTVGNEVFIGAVTQPAKVDAKLVEKEAGRASVYRSQATPLKPEDFAALYNGFNAAISHFDCGQKCSPLNGGEPVCCSTQNAVPIVHKTEFKLLKGRTDLWSKFKPYDATTGRIVEDLTPDCTAIRCKGARYCERDNRTIACRGFPFYPYITRQRQFVGIGTYWAFEDRCWMMSNLEIVDRKFVDEFITTYETMFAKDQGEFTTYVNFSASARRVFSRWGRKIALLGRKGELLIVEPSSGDIRPGKKSDFPKVGPFSSGRAYRIAVLEAGGNVPIEGLRASIGRHPRSRTQRP